MAKNKPGPKPFDPDWTEFDKLCAIQCTLREIASWFDCSEDTIERAVKRHKHMEFAEYYAQKAGKGKISLRRKQFELAMKGDRVMLIWLGKQVLGQLERSTIELSKISDDIFLADAQRRLNDSKPKEDS